MVQLLGSADVSRCGPLAENVGLQMPRSTLS